MLQLLVSKVEVHNMRRVSKVEKMGRVKRVKKIERVIEVEKILKKSDKLCGERKQ